MLTSICAARTRPKCLAGPVQLQGAGCIETFPIQGCLSRDLTDPGKTGVYGPERQHYPERRETDLTKFLVDCRIQRGSLHDGCRRARFLATEALYLSDDNPGRAAHRSYGIRKANHYGGSESPFGIHAAADSEQVATAAYH